MTKFDPETLRPAEFVCEPDPRNTIWVRVDHVTGTHRAVEICDHYEEISGLTLHSGVPHDVIVQFETAKNLCLYAWFIYRFYPVAEHHALACLELALRERFKDEIRGRDIKYKGKKPTLDPLLRYAVDKGLVKNEGFEIWRNRGQINARARVEMEKFREASEQGFNEFTWDESDIQITEEDLNWDYVKVLTEIMPQKRNNYAHGSSQLYPQSVLLTMQIISEIINQLYNPAS